MVNNMINRITSYLDELFPNPKCELNYNKDYELLIAVVLSAQTTDKRVNKVTEVLFEKYKSLKELKNSDIKDIEKIIKEIGTFRKKAIFVKDIARFLDENYDGHVPNNREVLESLNGVGRKTANVVLSNLFDEPCIAVDTHVSRVSKRLKLAYKNDSVEKIEKKLMKKLDKSIWSKTHHQMVLFGRYYCKAINPECNNCKLYDICREKRKNLEN